MAWADDCYIAPQTVYDEQERCRYEQHMHADETGEPASSECACEHADELRGLAEPVEAAEVASGYEPLYEVVDCRQESRDGYAVDEPPYTEPERCRDECLRDVCKPCQEQRAEQDELRPATVCKLTERRGEEHARKP